MTIVSPSRWRWCVAALALTAALTAPSIQAKTKATTHTSNVAPTTRAVPASAPSLATLANLHIFAAPDGQNPTPTLATDGTNVYGTATNGGTYNSGTVFRLAPDGTLTTLYSFGAASDANGNSTDGAFPQAAPVLAADGFLYGTTSNGGTNGSGTVYRLDPATGTLTTLASFNYNTTGDNSIGALVTDNNGNFYGVTSNGGTQENGTIFVYNTTAGTLTALYNFSSDNNGAYNPQAGLLLAPDGNIYGTTYYGGSPGYGTDFQFNPTTATFTVLVNFDYNNTGGYVQGKLVTDGNGNFFGTAYRGGSNGVGTAYEFTVSNPNTTPTATFTTLYNFNSDNSGAYYPQGGLVFGADGNLYGTSYYGGTNGPGTVFQLVLPTGGATTATFNIVHNFTNGNDGGYYNATLVADANGNLFGTTRDGVNGEGLVFELTPTTATVPYTYTFDTAYSFLQATGIDPSAPLTAGSDGNIYGTTVNGGSTNNGTVFVYSPATGATTTLYTFNDADNNGGAYPYGKLVEAAPGVFYGTTGNGGTNGYGTIFQLNVATDTATGAPTGTVTLLFSFTGNSTDGQYPASGLTLAPDGNYYGTTQNGGTANAGTVYQFNPTTGMVTTEATFVQTNGQDPYQSLLLASDGNLYGTTNYGGAGSNSNGTLFQFNPTTGTLTSLFSFSENGSNGYNPSSALIQGTDGLLYGTTHDGGTNGKGTLFQFDPTAGQLTTLVNFSPASGGNPEGSIVQAADGNFYGTTTRYSNSNDGTAYRFNPTTGAYVSLLDFGNAAGYNANGLTLGKDGSLYGTTTGNNEGGGIGDIVNGSSRATPRSVKKTSPSETRTVAQHSTAVPRAVTGPNASNDSNGSIFELLIAPMVTSSSVAVGGVKLPFGFQVTATFGPNTFAATGLPTGLTINATTGVISGTPTTAGNYAVTVTATNAGGSGTQTLTVVIQAAPAASAAPMVNSAASANAVLGQAFSYQITANNGPTSYGATGLPAGLSVDTVTGIISGTPTATGTYTVALSATNSAGTGTATLALKVTTVADVTPVVSSPASANAQAGLAFAYQVTASNSPTSFSATGLPAGLTISTTTGLISGMPTTAGTYTVTLSATNANGTGTAKLTLTVTAAALTAPVINSVTTASGQVAAAFAYQITASNSPIVFGATGLPAGLSVDVAKGLISGTPSEDGTFTVTLTAANSAGTGTATLTLTVAAQPLPVIDVAASVPSVTLGTGQTAEFVLTRTGGDPTQTVVVNYTVGGTAVADVDYAALKGSKTFKPGKTTVRIIVTPEGTLNGASSKSLKLTLQPGDGYTLGTGVKTKVKFLAPQ